MNNSNNPNENKRPELPGEKAEERKATINRAVYITAVVLLVSIAVIAGVVSAANRAKKNPDGLPSETNGTVNTPSESRPSVPGTLPGTRPSTPSESTPETDAPNTDVSGKLPTFALPAKGSLSVGHDPDLQVFSPTMKDYRVHLGIDINTEEGASVYAAAEGKVAKVWEDPMMGFCVAIEHSGNAVSYYKNLSDTLASGIKEGENIRAGQLIGTVGDTAMLEVAQEPHLHFEMTVGGLQVDPREYFSSDVLADLDSDGAYEG